jgi:hypothetical protein
MYTLPVIPIIPPHLKKASKNGILSRVGCRPNYSEYVISLVVRRVVGVWNEFCPRYQIGVHADSHHKENFLPILAWIPRQDVVYRP